MIPSLSAARGKKAIVLRYAAAPAWIVVAALLQVSPIGELSQPMGFFVLAVVAAGWFGGTGPGVLAGFLSALVLPHLIAAVYPQWLTFPPLAGVFDLPRFIVLGLTGFAVGWGASSLRRAERQLSKARDQLETAVAERTAHLAESEARYARAMEATAAGHWEWDLVTDKVFHSARFRELYDVPVDEAFADRDAWKARQPIPPDQRKHQEAALRAAIADPSKTYEMELSFAPRPGEVRWLHSRGKVFRDEQGRALRIAGATTDITAQKLGQEALQRSEQRYALAMEAAGDGHTDWNFVTGEFYVSPRMLEILGYAPGATFTDRADWVRRFPFHPEDRLKWEAAIAQHFAGREAKFRMDVRIVVRGETRWVAFTFIATRDASGKPIRWTGSIADINDRKRAEALLGGEKQLLEMMARATPLATVLDALCRTIEENLSGCLCGISLVDATGTRLGNGAAPSLPPGYVQAIDDKAMDRDAGPCCMAAVLREQVICPDVATDTRWQGWCDLALSHGLRSIWSTPIVSSTQKALGTFAIYFTQPSSPTDEQLAVIERFSHLAAVAIERADADQALRESEERYALAVAGSDAGVWDYDFVRQVHFSSERARELAGLPSRLAVPMEHGFAVLPLHPEDVPRRIEAMQAHLAGRTPMYEGEFRVRQSDGSYRWRRIQGLCVRDANGKPLRMAGSISDIDARKRAEESLRLSEERYALALEASEEGHFDNDLETGEIFVSARVNEIYGFPPQAEFSNRIDFLNKIPLHPDDRSRVLAELGKPDWENPADDLHQIECRIIPRPGEIRWIHSRAKVVRDAEGRPRRRVGVVADITERKRAEEALREQTERLQLGQAAMRMIIMDWDVAQDVLTWSDSPEWLRGPMPAGGSYPLFKDQIHPEDRDRFLASRRRALEALQVQTTEFRLVRTDGEVIWVLERKHAFAGADGQAVRMLSAMFDITDRKRAEEALRLSEQRYAVAMEVAEEGHFDWNVQTDEIFTSPQALRVIGVPDDIRYRTRADVMARMRYHREDWPRISAEWRGALEGRGVEHEFEYRILRNDEPRSIRGRWKIFRDAAGTPLRVVGVIADVTARKRAETGLRASEERYALAVAGSDDGVWDVDFAAQLVFLSARARELTGFAPGPEIMPLEEFQAVLPIHPEDAPRRAAALQAHLSGEAPAYVGEFRLRQLDGTYRWRRIHGICVRDANGQPQRMAGSFSDVDARKRAEDALRLSEERYALAAAGSNDGIWDWDLLTQRMFVSERAQRIFGLEPGPTERKREEWHAMIAFHPRDHEAQRRMVEEYLSGRRSTNEGDWRVQGKDGGYRWIRIRSMCLRNAAGEPVRMAGSVSDIDAQKNAQEALRLSEERYALAMRASGEGHWDWKIATDEFYASPRYLEIGGFAPDLDYGGRGDVVGRIPFHPDDRARYDAAVAAHFAGETPRMDIVVRIVPHGEVRWLHVIGVCVRDARGKPLRWGGSVNDITARKLAEQARRLSEERYALAMDASEEGHFDWNVATDEIFASEHLKKLLDLPPDVDLRTRGDMVSRMPFYPGDGERVAEMMREVLAGAAREHEFEYRLLREQGAPARWIRARWNIFRDSQGTAERVIGVVSDITERRRVGEALRQSEERYALAVDGASQGIFDWDLTTDRVFHSRRAQELFGLEAGESWRARREWAAMIRYHPEDVPLVRASIQRHLNGEKPTCDGEFRVVPPEGGIRWLRQRGVALRDASGKPYRMAGSIEDITARKVAAEALRDSEARFRGLTALWSDWYWQQDDELRFTYSSAAGEWPGGSRRSSTIGLARWDIPGVVPLSSSWAEHRQLLAERKPFRDFEYCRPSGGGAVRYVSSSGTPIFDDKGEFRGYQGVARDITERKRVEEELRSRKEMLELAQAAARAVPWQWRNGAPPEENRWSAELAAMFGVRPQDFDGTTDGWWRLIHPDDRQRVKASIARALASGEVDVEYRAIHPDGKVRWLNQKGRAFVDGSGKPVRSIGFMFDITERRKVEEDLRSRQEMLDLAQKSARVIAFEWKIGATGEGENQWSPDLEAMYGFAPGAYDGSFDSWKERVHPHDWPRVRQAIEHAERTGDVACEYRVVHPDGSTHWLQARGRLFFDAAGNPARMVGFMQDMTQRKQGEQELRQLEQKLRRAQRLEGMGTLAGGIAHDFNNILGAILGYGEMAMRDAKKGSRLRRDLDAIMAAGERGRSLVDRILAFSRSGVGERVPVHVEEVVREALDQLSAHLPENVTIAPRLRAGRAAMLGDSTQVHQVVMNLTNNAVQAMPKGGVLRISLESVVISTARPAVIGTLSRGEYIALRVADAGTGIAPDVLERMFDPFFTTKEVGVGSGLGLSLVHGIVSSVGGAIDVATELGKGSAFTVFFPRSGDAPAQTVDEGRPLARGEGQRVLVVDDEEPLVRLASETLEELGYSPVGFTSSTSALKAFTEDPGRFDAILTDERMPGVTGSTIIREVRRIDPSIPIVLMSGFVGAAVALKARELGANDVLKKPLLARELATSLARVLRPSA